MEKSKTIVYENGDILNIDKVKGALRVYWNLNNAERQSFNQLRNRPDLELKHSKNNPEFN